MLHDIKGKLARLLATENLIVEHKKVETASFNVDTRVLVLPSWRVDSNYVYDLLVSHEVGHALYTPNRNWIAEDKYRSTPHQFVNIIEDVRIEKLMKRKYAGLSKTFYRGYNNLNEDDFFCIGEDDLSTYSFPDRINLHFKIGAFLNIQFSPAEKVILDKISKAETFDEVLDLSTELKEFCEKKQQEKEKDMPPPPSAQEQEGSSESGGAISTVPNTAEGDEEGTGDPEVTNTTEERVETVEGPGGDEFDTQTMDALEEKLKDLVDMYSGESVYVQVPKVELDKVIADVSEIRECLTDYWERHQRYRNDDRKTYNLPEIDIFETVDSKYREFKKSANKEVNYLVKEFECRKSADAYARASTSRTGVLDTTKLHTYRFNEDLFKKVTVLPDGKNHGLVFVLDWSGSMERVLLDSVKQIMNLAWFCKKVGIPFEVYAFTNEWFVRDPEAGIRPEKCERIENELHVTDDFGLMNLLSSRSNQLDTDMRNFFRLGSYFSSWRTGNEYVVPNRMTLSGTPLNEAIVCLHQIIPAFKKMTGAQKIQCIIFTDGEAAPICRNRVVQRSLEHEPYMGHGRVSYGSFLRNRKTGVCAAIEEDFKTFTKVLLEDLSQTFPDVNLIGFRVLESRDSGGFIRRYAKNTEWERITKEWRKNRSFTLTDTGYAKYFGLSGSDLSKEVSFDVDDSATKTQIRNAFKKSLSTKKMNKKVLSEFVELIA